MGGTSLLAEPFLDDDEDVRRVQRFAGAGARTGAKLGAIGGPVGAGVGAGFGSAAGYLLGYGLTGVDPARRADVADEHGTASAGDETRAGGNDHGHDDDHEHGPGHDHDHDDGPITIEVTEADS